MNNCITIYSKVGCSPCNFLMSQIERKYKGCYNKIIAKTNEEALVMVESKGQRFVPFIELANGEIIDNRGIYEFIKNI